MALIPKPTPPMDHPHGATHWLDRPRNRKRLWRGFLVLLALTVLAQALVPTPVHFEFETVFGFNAWFGFLSCVLTIAVAKALALWLKRRDTYYGAKDE